MRIFILTLEFHLPGCNSLKEKRHALSGMRTRFGKMPNIAACESDHHDVHDRAQWSFIAVASTMKIVDSLLNQVEAYADEDLDAVIINSKREEL